MRAQRAAASRSGIAEWTPKTARLVARGAHDAALRPGPPPPTIDRLAAQLGPVALLDGREERVEVDVEDRPVDRRLEAHLRMIAPPSTDFDRMFESSDRRHAVVRSPSSSYAATGTDLPFNSACPAAGTRRRRRSSRTSARR